MDTKISLCYLRLLLSLLLWAGAIFVVRHLVTYTNIYLVADIRYVISAVILLVWHRLQRGCFIPTLNYKQWFSILLVSVFGIVIYNILFLSAMRLISGSVYAMIFALVPTLTTTIAIFVFKIKFNKWTVLGVLGSFVSTVMLISVITPDCRQFFCSSLFEHGIGIGELLAFLATLSFSLFAIANSYSGRLGVHSLELNVYSVVFGLCGLLVASSFHVHVSEVVALVHLPLIFWADMIYLTVFATVLSYIWYTQAVLRIGVAATSVLQNTMPLQSVIIGYFIMGDTVSSREIIAGLMILCGVYITNFSLNYAKNAK